MSENRLLQPENIPSSLWLADEETLIFPASLRAVYARILEEQGLGHLVDFGNGEGAVGGLSKEDTDRHFAQAFSGSVARVLLAVLDPKNEVADASDAFIRCTSGSSVCITDAPCGSGAAAAAYLCAIAELRAEKVIPREPLAVRVIGGELSPTARKYAEDVMDKIKPFLEEQAIFVSFQFHGWDVKCQDSTADLVTECILGSVDTENKMLMIANFSSFLQSSGNRKSSERQLGELFRYASVRKSFAVWMEPPMNKVLESNGLFTWLSGNIVGVWKSFAKALQRWKSASGAGKGQFVARSEAKFRHPLDSAHTPHVRLAVVAMALERN